MNIDKTKIYNTVDFLREIADMLELIPYLQNRIKELEKHNDIVSEGMVTAIHNSDYLRSQWINEMIKSHKKEVIKND